MSDKDKTAEEIEEALEHLDDIECTLPDTYPFENHGLDPDQLLRLFIMDGFVGADYEGRIMVESLDMLFKWIKTGETPPKPDEKPAKSRLKLVQPQKE